MKKIFIIGANGFIGSELAQKLSGEYAIKRVSPDNKDGDLRLNLEKSEEFDFSQIGKNDIIIHLAAISSPDICAKEYGHTYKINVTGTSHFIEKCLGRGAKVLFFSSDTVYGASNPKGNDCFDESSDCNPLGEYGKMKREIEKKFLEKRGFKVFRLSYVFSKNDKFTLYLKNCCEKGEIADVFHPFFRNAVYLEDIIAAVDKMIDKWDNIKEAIFNLAGPENISRKRMAELYKKEINPNLRIKIIEPEKIFFHNRPKFIRVKSLYAEKLLGRPLTEISQAYIREKGE